MITSGLLDLRELCWTPEMCLSGGKRQLLSRRLGVGGEGEERAQSRDAYHKTSFQKQMWEETPGEAKRALFLCHDSPIPSTWGGGPEEHVFGAPGAKRVKAHHIRPRHQESLPAQGLPGPRPQEADVCSTWR